MALTESITVKRLLNLGKFENITVEKTIKLNSAYENVEEATERLIEEVERDVRKNKSNKIEKEIQELLDKKLELIFEVDKLERKKYNLKKSLESTLVNLIENNFKKEEIAELFDLKVKTKEPIISEIDTEDEEEENNY